MEKLSTYYQSLDIKTRGSDSIFRELCIADSSKNLDNGIWKETFINKFGELLDEAPNIRKIAGKLINEGLKAKGFNQVDAEKVYFNTFTKGVNVGAKYYLHEKFTLINSHSLVDVAVMDVFVKDFWYNWNDLGSDYSNGVYAAGPDADKWDGSNIMPFSSKVVADILYYDKNVKNSFKNAYQAYWDKYFGNAVSFFADVFLASAIIQYRNKMLSEDGFALVRKAYYGNNIDVFVLAFNVYGYQSSDILVMNFITRDKVILYIPGAARPFMEFPSVQIMKSWIASQLKNLEFRQAFQRHFSLWDRTDGGTYYGVDTVLRYIAEENSSWDPQTYLLYGACIRLNPNSVFNDYCKNIKNCTISNRDMSLDVDADNFPDFIYDFSGLFFPYMPVVKMIMPEVELPVNIESGCTPLGLGTDFYINEALLDAPVKGVGSRAYTEKFKMLKLIGSGREAALKMRSVLRPSIPAFASEKDALFARFGLTENQLNTISVGDEPCFATGDGSGKLRLVRLANKPFPLTVLKKCIENSFYVVDAVTLEKTEAGFATMAVDPISGKEVYVVNSELELSLPYNPYEFGFENIMSLDVFLKKLNTDLSKMSSAEIKIYRLLEDINCARSLSDLQGKFHILIEEINWFLKDVPSYANKNVLVDLRYELENVIYWDQMYVLKNMLLTDMHNYSSSVAKILYDTALQEYLGDDIGVSELLWRFILNDNIASIAFEGDSSLNFSSNFDFKPTFVFNDLTVFNNLSTRYFEQAPYNVMGCESNVDILQMYLTGPDRNLLFDKCFANKYIVVLGYDYEELCMMISEFSSGDDKKYGAFPMTFLSMLRELSGNEVDFEAGLMKSFAFSAYFRSVVEKRLNNVKDIVKLCDNFDFSLWDNTYGRDFKEEFGVLIDNNAKIDKLMGNGGMMFNNSANDIDFFIANYLKFVGGSTKFTIMLTDLYSNVNQHDIDFYLSNGVCSAALDAILLTLDKGIAEGPFRRLLGLAKSKGYRVIALADSDGSIMESENLYTKFYFRGTSILNLVDEFDNLDGRFVVFGRLLGMNSTPGINYPLPGIVQVLNIPGVYIDQDGVLNLFPFWDIRSIIVDFSDDFNLGFSPQIGKLVDLSVFDYPYWTAQTQAKREAILKAKVGEAAWPEFKAKVDSIKVAMTDFVVNVAGQDDLVAYKIEDSLNALGFVIGNGVSLTWWSRLSSNLPWSFLNHSVPTVLIDGNEYVVDSSHLQFTSSDQDEGTIVLPIDNWIDEIANRNHAVYPYVVFKRLSGSALDEFSPLFYICPHLSKDIK